MTSHVRRTASNMRAAGRMALIEAAQYRVNTAVWLCTGLIQIVIYLTVWRTIATARGGDVAGFTPETFAGYFIGVLVVRQVTLTSVRWWVPRNIRSGQIAPRLLRPLHPLTEFWGFEIGEKVQEVLILLPAAIMMFIWFDASAAWSIPNIAASLVVLPLAALVMFLVSACVGCIAFWLTNIDAINSIFFAGVLLLGGQFAPIDALPEQMQMLARLLPFWWTLGYPAQLLTGSVPASGAWQAILVLATWAAVLVLVLRVIWGAGIRRHEAVGG